MLDLEQYFRKNVVVKCTNGKEYKGFVDNVTSAANNEDIEEGIPKEESIDLSPQGLWLFESDIESIDLL